LKSIRRGQTSLEYLFVLAMILLSVSAIVASYARTSSSMGLTAMVRESGNLACSYINTDVVRNSSQPYSYLNDAITYLNYRTPLLNVGSINVTIGSSVYINMTVIAGTLLNSTAREKLGGYISSFVASYLIANKALSGSVSNLTYKGKPVKLEVRVIEG